MSVCLNEPVNAEMCDLLMYMSFTEYSKMINSEENENIIETEKNYKKIKKYLKFQRKNNYFGKITYKFSKNSFENEGRLFCEYGNGIQNINKKIRGLLSKDLYLDFDMINAHPNILRYLCEKNNIMYDCLLKYINDRENILEEFKNELDISREDAKICFLKQINYNKVIRTINIKGKKKIIKNKFYLDYCNEIINIQKKLKEKNKKLLKQLIDEKEVKENIEGKLTNYLLCKYENQILQLVIKDIDVSILMFDGFMIKKELIEDNNKFIKKLNNLSKKFYIKWNIKENDLSLEEDLRKIKKVEKIYYSEDNIIELCNKLLENELKNRIFNCNGELWTNLGDNIRWINNKDEIERILYNFITSNDFNLITSKSVINLNDKLSFVSELIKAISLKAKINENFERELYDNSLCKIVFNNGYYDFNKRKFINNFDNLQTVRKINYDFKNEWNEEVNNELMEKIFYPIFGIDSIEKDKEKYELMEYFLQRLSRNIAGNVEDKRFFILCGLRDCGKGVICDLLKNTFEKYIYSTDSSNLLYKKNNGDSAKNNSWIIDLIYTRITLTNEITLDEKEYIDGNKIKKLCSGGDYLTGRKNFKDEIEFRIQSSLMIACNDLPQIIPNDTLEKSDSIDFSSKFIDENYTEQKLTNIKYYKSDENIKKVFIKRQDIKNQFILLLIKYYNKSLLKYPEQIKLNQMEDDENTDDITMLKSIFLQGNEDNIISNKDIKDHLKKNKINISMKMFNKKIKGIYKVSNYKSSYERGLKGLSIID